MSHTILGVVLGLGAGAIAVALMIPMRFADKRAALTGAFASRFATGFLAVNTSLPLHPILAGAGIGLLISLPDAIITKAYVPIMVIGTALGALSGTVLLLFG